MVRKLSKNAYAVLRWHKRRSHRTAEANWIVPTCLDQCFSWRTRAPRHLDSQLSVPSTTRLRKLGVIPPRQCLFVANGLSAVCAGGPQQLGDRSGCGSPCLSRGVALCRGRLRLFDKDGLNGGLQQLTVMDVCAVTPHSHGVSVFLDNCSAVRAGFAAVRGVSVRFSPKCVLAVIPAAACC